MSTEIDQFDAIIIGAGINGCGVAAELTARNQRVLLLERKAIGSGTSSKSSRLIHGGLRYLETARFGLVHEALRDRQELLVRYPQLVEMRPFYLPVYRSSPRPAWMIGAGLKLYDLLSGSYSEYKSRRIPKNDFNRHAPALSDQDLKAVFQYYDGKTDDLELTRQVAAEAHDNGCVIHEHIQVKKIGQLDDTFQVLTNRGSFSAPMLVNATGPWIDEVNQEHQLPANYHIRKISGIHIIIDGLLTADLMFMQTGGKRIFFIIPEPQYQRTIIGTTEREEHGPCDAVSYDDADIEYLLENINRYLRSDSILKLTDVHDVWIGIRPLIARKNNPTDLSREYILDHHRQGRRQLLHIFGGKLTTFLSLARKSADLLSIRQT